MYKTLFTLIITLCIGIAYAADLETGIQAPLPFQIQGSGETTGFPLYLPSTSQSRGYAIDRLWPEAQCDSVIYPDCFKFVYAYDNQRRLTQEEDYLWSPETGAWDMWGKTERAYDDWSNEILYIYYVAKDGEWVPKLKNEYSYDANGNLTLSGVYNWTEFWRGWSKDEYSYDNDGKRCYEKHYEWSYEINDWGSYWMIEYEYNADGTIALETYSTKKLDEECEVTGKKKYEYTYEESMLSTIVTTFWDANTDKWFFETKEEYDHNAASHLHTLVKYVGNWDEEWVPESRDEWETDDNGNEKWRISSRWRASEECWQKVSLAEYDYDAQDRVIMQARYRWSDDKEQWTGSDTKLIFAYDDNGNFTYLCSYAWSDGLNDWRESRLNEQTYDESNHLLSYQSYIWDEPTNSWRKTESREMAYEYECDTPNYTIIYSWSDATQSLMPESKKEYSDFISVGEMLFAKGDDYLYDIDSEEWVISCAWDYEIDEDSMVVKSQSINGLAYYYFGYPDQNGLQPSLAQTSPFSVSGNRLIVGAEGITRVYSIDGKLVYSGADKEILIPSAGTYVAVNGSYSTKIFIR